MDIYLKVYKYYNLGITLSKKEIVKKLKSAGIKGLRTYDLDENLEESPNFVSYPEPIEFDYNLKNIEGGFKAKVYDYGAMSVMSDTKYEVNSLKEFYNIIKHKNIKEKKEKEFDKVYYKIIDNFEAIDNQILSSFNHLYSVYCIDHKNKLNTANIINENDNIIVSLLTDEYLETSFSVEQKEAVLKNNNSFLANDYTIIHWNNALIVDKEENFLEKLFMIELANIQFVKLKTYDSLIDTYLDEYLSKQKSNKLKFLPFIKSGLSGKVKEIANLRVELEQIIDMMDNFEKYKGNWYLARLYYLANNAFQINRWKNLLEKRINKVNDLYNLINSEINRKRMLFLNILMLLLFVLWFLGV